MASVWAAYAGVKVPPPLAGCHLARRRIAVMARKPNAKQKNTPKRVLRLPDLDHSKRTVLDSLGSPDSARAYAFAMSDFISWYCFEPRVGFCQHVVLRGA